MRPPVAIVRTVAFFKLDGHGGVGGDDYGDDNDRAEPLRQLRSHKHRTDFSTQLHRLAFSALVQFFRDSKLHRNKT